MDMARILIVEDDAILVAHLEATLSQIGYQVSGLAATGEEAVEAALAQTPDAILMDIRLRGEMTGIQAAKEIHRQMDIPIVYLTAYSDEVLLQEAKLTDAYAYLAKPVRDRELRASLEMALYKHASEQRVQHLNQVLRALRDTNQLITHEHDPQRLQEEACKILVRTRGYRLVWIGLPDGGCIKPVALAGEGKGFIDLITATASEEQARQLPWATAFHQKQPVICHDVLSDERYEPWREQAEKAHFFSSITLPILSDGRQFGVLCVLAEPANVFNDEEIDLLLELTGDLAFGLKTLEEEAVRKQAERELRKFRLGLERSTDAIFITDIQGRITYTNLAFQKTYGYHEDEALGKTPRILKSGVIPQERYKEFWGALLSKRPVVGEILNKTKEGRILPVEGSNIPILDDADNILGFLAIHRDITERKQREQELEAIATVSAALRTALTRAEMLPVVLDQVNVLLAVDGVSLSMRDPLSGEAIIELGRGTGEAFTGRHVPPGAGVTGHVIATGRPYVTNDAQHDPLFIWPHLLGELRAVACVPLIAQEQTVGALWVGRQLPFTDGDVRVLNAIADIAASAIHRAALFEAERDQRALTEALRQAATALTSTLNFDEVLDHILFNAGRVVPYDFANVMLIESGTAYVVRSRGYSQHDVEAFLLGLRLVINDVPTLHQMANTGRPLIIADTREFEGWLDIPELAWIRSYAGIPIRVKDEVVGFLSFDSAIAGFFTPMHAERLRAFADQVAIAIENARLYQEVHRYAEELETRVADRTRELSEANRRLQDLDRMKDQFVSNVSHELRTPQANIKLYLKLLERGKADKHDEYMQTLRRETERLELMIEGLLDLSRLDRGVTPIQPVPTDLHQLLEQLVADRSALAAEHGLTLEYQPTPHLAMALADATTLMQVISNLVTNAINYTPPGGVVTVTTSMQQHEIQDWVTFTVRDTGPGISEADLPHLFERFYRGAVGRKASAPGTGLGLAISKEIVEKTGGRITVENEPGQGAVFTVWLPLAQVQPDDGEDQRSEILSPFPATSTTTFAPAAGFFSNK